VDPNGEYAIALGILAIGAVFFLASVDYANKIQNNSHDDGSSSGGPRFFSESSSPGTPPPEDNEPNLRAEKSLYGSKKHGLDWKGGPARAKKSGKPQGQFKSEADINFAVSRARTLRPGQSDEFLLPRGSKSIVHKPDGTWTYASRVWVRRNKSGTVHAYPKE
jgi:hypothetical protein